MIDWFLILIIFFPLLFAFYNIFKVLLRKRKIALPFILILSLTLSWWVSYITESSFFVWFFVILLLLFLLWSYLIFVLNPQLIAYNSLSSLRKKIRRKDKKRTVWVLLDTVKRQRLVVFIILIFLILASVLLNAILMDRIFTLSEQEIKIDHYSPYSYQLKQNYPSKDFIIFGSLFLFTFVMLDVISYGRFNFSEVKHGRTNEIKKIVENLSIRTGVEKPFFKIISHDNPNIFSVYPNFGQPTIFITIGLLNLLDRNELEAAIASQIVEIYSGKIFDYKWINNFLTLFKGLGFIPVFLILSIISPESTFVWFLLSCGWIFVVIISDFFPSLLSEEKETFYLLLKFINPLFVFFNFLSFLVYYFLTFNDTFYTDLKSIEITRFPNAYYSTLTKVHKSAGYLNLPRNIYYLYFVGETAVSSETPLPQPPVKLRKEIIEETEPSLKDLDYKPQKQNLICPYCKKIMIKEKISGYYGSIVEIDRCKYCGGFWFDNLEIFSALKSIEKLVNPLFKLKEFNKELKTTKLPENFLCPRCKIRLDLVKDPTIPSNIKVKQCESCKGFFLNAKDLSKYHQHIVKLRKKI